MLNYCTFEGMNSHQITQVKALLSTCKNAVIVVHKNPDGDAMGSGLALQEYLNYKGINAQLIVPNEYPKFLKWLPNHKSTLNFEWEQTKAKKTIQQADIIFTLDFNDLSRAYGMEESLKKATADFIMIDHHQEPDDYATVTYSDVSMSSTCEMVYNFIDFLGDNSAITADIATCLYTGIMTDTGSFKFSSTTSKTHRVIADLIDKGAQNTQIHQNVFDTNSPSRLHLLGVALNNLVILEDYNTSYISLTQEELDTHGYSKGDTEGFVNYGLTLDNINFAVIFIENKAEGIIKISFRSIGDFSVNEFARAHFSGGGHNNAAGGRSELSIKETISKFVALLDEYKDQLTA